MLCSELSCNNFLFEFSDLVLKKVKKKGLLIKRIPVLEIRIRTICSDAERRLRYCDFRFIDS